MGRDPALSGDLASLTRGLHDVRACENGDLPTMQQLKPSLGSRPRSGGPKRATAGFPFIGQFDASSSSSSSRNLKTAPAASRSRSRSGSTTQIVMFPTPTHAVRPSFSSSQGSRSLPILPPMDRKHRPPSGRSLASSTPTFSTLTRENLEEAGRSRAQTADATIMNRLPSGASVGSFPKDTSPVAKQQPKKKKANVSFDVDDKDPDPSNHDSAGEEEEDTVSPLPQQKKEARPQLHRRRTFHHQYTVDEHGNEEKTAIESVYTDQARGDNSPPNQLAACTLGLDASIAGLWKDDPELEESKDTLRHELLMAAGCEPEMAFRSIDLSRSGNVSLQEFTDGMTRLCVNWQATEKKNLKEVFKMFVNKDGVVTIDDLFPETRRAMTAPNRMSTPEFWNYWCKSNPKDQMLPEKRGPKWLPDPDEELQDLFRETEARQGVTDRKRWMSQTIRRMKALGKSDARCRELCASHLPRGTGPRDKEYVPTFTAGDVKICKREYNDAISGPLRNIQKQVYAMKEQRMELQNYKMELRRMAQQNARDQRKQQRGHRYDIPEDDSDDDDDDLHTDGKKHGGKDADPLSKTIKSIFQKK